MAITARGVVRRIEVWSGWKAAGGTVQTSIPDYIDCKAQIGLTQDRLTVSFPISSQAASYATARKVIRVVQNDSVFDEWRIVDRQTDRVHGIITVNATSMRSTDVSEGALVRRLDSDGVINYDFESVGLTPTEHISTWVLPALAAAGFGWITLGTITPTARLDLVFSWDTPLTVLLRLAEATQTELDIRRNGTTGYLIDLVTKVNASAVQADIRFDKNMVNIQRDEDTIEMATRVFPRGAQDADGNHSTMARAEWEVGLVSGSDVALVDPSGGTGPIQFDDQLNGLYLRKIDGSLVQVTDSFASSPAQTVTLASVAGITAGDLIQFRADSAGTDLTSLTNPVTVTSSSYGEKVGVVDVPAVSGAKNVVPNPFMRDWPGTLPDGWTEVNNPVTSKQTAAPYTALGGASIKVVSSADGQGVLSPAGSVFPSVDNPFGSGYARVWVVSGQVRVELVITTPTGTVIVPLPAQGIASNSILGQWEDLGVAGIDLNAIGATAVAVRVVQHGLAAATFYVDAAQSTQTATQEGLIEGSGGTRLWQAANELLRTNSVPIVSYTVPLVDLEAMDAVVWAESALVIGGPVRIRDDTLNLDLVSRILELNPRDYIDPGKTAIVISNRYDDLVNRLAAKPTPPRKLLPRPRDPTPIPNLPPFIPGSGPEGLSGCMIWLKADSLLATLYDGTTVSFWPDSSGNAKHANQGTGMNQPTFRTGIVNGMPVVEFATNDFMTTATALNPALGSTLFTVMRQNNALRDQARFLAFGNGANAGGSHSLKDFTGAAGAMQHASLRWALPDTELGGTVRDWHILSLRIGSQDSIKPRYDRSATLEFNPDDGINATHGISVGALYDGTLPIDAQFAEIIVFNRDLSVAEELLITNYLSAKYAVAVPPAILQPNDVSNLELWLKADALSLANDTPVGSFTDHWTDSGPQTNDAVNQTLPLNQPLFKTNVINGLPVVQFFKHPTEGDFLFTDQQLGTAGPGRTFIIVSKKIGALVDAQTYWAQGDLNGDNRMLEAAGNRAAFYSGGAGDTILFPRVSTAEFGILGLVVLNANSATPYCNYVSGLTFDPTHSDILSAKVFTIGAWFVTPNTWSDRIDAQFAEIIIYNRAISVAEYRGVVAYLIAKYGLTVT